MDSTNKMKRKFRQEYFIIDGDSLKWFLILIECDESDTPLQTYIIKVPETDGRFKLYPYIIN
jgi:hypothetical protein